MTSYDVLLLPLLCLENFPSHFVLVHHCPVLQHSASTLRPEHDPQNTITQSTGDDPDHLDRCDHLHQCREGEGEGRAKLVYMASQIVTAQLELLALQVRPCP